MEVQAAFAVLRQCLVVTLLGETDALAIGRLQSVVLTRVASDRVRGVVFDASAVTVLDSFDIDALVRTLAMCRLLGARGVVVGLSVPVVAALMTLDAPIDGLEAEATVEAALKRLLSERNAA